MAHSLLDYFADTAFPGQKVIVTLRNNRAVVGSLVAYDLHYNLILKQAKEMWRVDGRVVSKEHKSLYVRGDTVVAVARPPQEMQQASGMTGRNR